MIQDRRCKVPIRKVVDILSTRYPPDRICEDDAECFDVVGASPVRDGSVPVQHVSAGTIDQHFIPSPEVTADSHLCRPGRDSYLLINLQTQDLRPGLRLYRP